MIFLVIVVAASSVFIYSMYTDIDVYSTDENNNVAVRLSQNESKILLERLIIMNFGEKIKQLRLENKWNIEDRVIFKDSTNRLLGIYEVRDNMLVTWKNFN